MIEKLKKILDGIIEKWKPLSILKKVLIITVPTAVIIVAVVLTALLNQQKYDVLFKNVSSEEAGKIVEAINTMGVTDVTITSTNDIVVPKENVDSLRFKLNMEGYPSTGLNYDIWDNNVDLFSSDFEKRETQRRQLESNIANTLKSFDAINSAIVNLSIPESENYVINPKKNEASASVTLNLKNGVKLSKKEINGVYQTVLKSSSQLSLENISVVDSALNELKYTENIDSDGENDRIELEYRRLDFQKDLENVLSNNLHELFSKLYGEDGYAIAVTSRLNYDKKVSEEVVYTPSVGDSGIISNEDTEHSAEGNSLDGGVIGVTPDADASPSYPTLQINPEGDFYYNYKREVNYLVNTMKTQMEKDGYTIDSLDVSVAVNQYPLDEASRGELVSLIANAVGTDPKNISVIGRQFSGLKPTPSNPITTSPINELQNYLIYIAIGLALILVILLFIYLFTGKSKKKYRKTEHREPVFAADGMIPAQMQKPEEAEVETPAKEAPEEFQLASLSEQANIPNKEAMLKREIGDFSRTNPDIVASLIRNLMKNDDDD